MLGPVSGSFAERDNITAYQCFLFCSAPAFQLTFCRNGIGYTIKSVPVNQRNRPAGLRIPTIGSIIMLCDTSLEISSCSAIVKSPVSAL
jgi:hypothetical protein